MSPAELSQTNGSMSATLRIEEFIATLEQVDSACSVSYVVCSQKKDREEKKSQSKGSTNPSTRENWQPGVLLSVLFFCHGKPPSAQVALNGSSSGTGANVSGEWLCAIDV